MTQPRDSREKWTSPFSRLGPLPLTHLKNVIAQFVETFPLEGSDQDLGRALNAYGSKELRATCTRLRLNPQADPLTSNKEGYISLLRANHRQHQTRVADASAQPPRIPTKAKEPQATQHSRFRLVKVLFGDVLIEHMGEMDAIPGREAVDVGAANDRSLYWRDVAREFASLNQDYGRLVMVREDYEDIHPGDVQPLSATKLQKLWGTLRSLYGTANAGFTRSGTNDQDFFLYCDGRLDVLYVHDWLFHRPNHDVFVQGVMPGGSQANTLRGKRTAAAAPDLRRTSAKRQHTTSSFEDKVLADLDHEAQREQEVFSVNEVAGLADAAIKCLQFIKDLKAAGASVQVIDETQQKVNMLLAKWNSTLDKAVNTS